MKGIIRGKFSFNNTFFSLTKENGEVLANVSAGSIVLDNGKKVTGSRKSSHSMAEKAAGAIIKKSKEKGIYEIELKVRGVGSGRKIAIKRIRDDEHGRMDGRGSLKT